MSDRTSAQSPIWMGILVGVAVLSSFALACGMPFAAIGALAALTLGWRDAMILAGLAWLTNQVIGFGFLNYPIDPLTLAWGLALGLSAFAAVGGAMLAVRLSRTSGIARMPLSFAGAWASQQVAVFVASLVLGGTSTAFAADVVWFILWTNAVAFLALVLAQGIGSRIGLARPISIGLHRPVDA